MRTNNKFVMSKCAVMIQEKENYMNFLDDFKKRRVPMFKTKTGRGFLRTLLPKSESYFD